MRFYLLFWACVLVLAPLSGCNDSSETGGAGGTAGTGGTGGSAGSGGTAGSGGVVTTREYQIRFTGVEPDDSIAAIADVELCQIDTDNCALSDEFGTATLEVPADQEVAFTAEKEGYGKLLIADVSDENIEAFAQRRLYTDEQLEAAAVPLGVDYPWTAPIVGLVINPSRPEGVTFAPVGTTVGEVGDEFYYDSTTGEYSVALDAGTAVAEDWYLPLGAGGFTEVTPGEQQFEFGGTASNCEASWAWPGGAPNTIRVPVREGYRTYASMLCEE